MRKRQSNKTSKSHQFSIGLSDLGANSQLALPSRPLTTGRLLPHIGRKHLQKDQTTSGTKPSSSVSGCNSAVGPRKTGQIIRTHTDSHSQDFRRKEQLDSPLKISDQKLTQSNITTLDIKTEFEGSGCLLNPNNLHPFLGSKLTPTPPTRKPVRKQLNGGAGEQEAAKNLNEMVSLKSNVAENNKVIPSSNFKPVISVRNLELNHSSKTALESNRNFACSRETIGDRALPSRDRASRLRHTHPQPTPPNAN